MVPHLINPFHFKKINNQYHVQTSGFEWKIVDQHCNELDQLIAFIFTFTFFNKTIIHISNINY